MRVKVRTVDSQVEALRELAKVARAATIDPLVVQTARQITADCPSRDAECELEAIFNAVKYGDPRVERLARGVRYVSDPRFADLFSTPRRLLEQCADGACAGDCDDHSALVCALTGALGFVTALRAWGPRERDELVHVYAIAGLPKNNPSRWVGLDTTSPDSFVGWEPPRGHVINALVSA